jgi:type IV secretory pathway VirB4 component
MLKKLQDFLVNRQKQKQNTGERSTQELLEVEDIKDDVIITKDQRLVAVIWVSAINLDLMSKAEQRYVFESFEVFLSGLNDNIQFENVAEPVNLRHYLKSLLDTHGKETNGFKKRLLASYTQFVDENQTKKSIVKKEHYIVIDEEIKGKDDFDYHDALEDLSKRVREIKQQIREMLGQDMHLDCNQLNNNQLLALLQVFYNYQEALYQPVEDVGTPQVIRGEATESGNRREKVVQIETAG